MQVNATRTTPKETQGKGTAEAAKGGGTAEAARRGSSARAAPHHCGRPIPATRAAPTPKGGLSSGPRRARRKPRPWAQGSRRSGAKELKGPPNRLAPRDELQGPETQSPSKAMRATASKLEGRRRERGSERTSKQCHPRQRGAPSCGAGRGSSRPGTFQPPATDADVPLQWLEAWRAGALGRRRGDDPRPVTAIPIKGMLRQKTGTPRCK